MIWLYVFACTVGVMLIVPTVVQAIDRGDQPRASERGLGAQLFEFFGFAATTFGVAGVVISEFEPGRGTVVIAALTLGLAAGAVHPEILAALGRPGPHD